MPIFRYKGYSTGGKAASGTLEAEGLKNAISKVKALGLHPKSVEPGVKKQRWDFVRKSSASRLPAITRQLSVMLRSGVPLTEALRALSDERRGYWHDVLVDIREKVASGASLSRAMEGFEEKNFPEFYTNMVAAGEESGTLEGVLERLAQFLERQEAVKEKIKTATYYPVFMAAVGMVVLAFIFTFVVPKIVRIFEDTEAALPLATVVLINISNLFVNYWWLLLGAAALAVMGARKGRVRYKRLFDKGLLQLFGSLYLSRFARNLGFLLGGGLPVLHALELAGRASGNRHLEAVVRDSTLRVSEGSSISSALAGLPPVLLQLIATGERSGRLPEILDQAADAYEGDFDRKVQRALALLEPAMILLMGLVVGFIVFAVLLPMFQLNQLVQ
jgi:general secretion pathway protein F